MELFDQAVDLSEEDRPALFARVDADEPALGAELRALVAQDGARGDFLASIDGRLDPSALAAGAGAPPAPDHEDHGAGGSDDAAPDPHQGSVVAGRYRIEALLGRGSMGSVYRARDTAAARDVAVKLLRADLMHDPRHVLRFRREFRAIARLDHPGCVAVFEEGRHERQRYLVMEYVAGGNLGRLTGAGEGVLLPVLVELADALAYVHGRRVIHRDLKPANVLLTPGARPRPRLADFGIVRLTDEVDGKLTDTGAVLGTIDYLAPEQLDGHPPDPRSDLYALGCIIFALWAERPPFLGTPLQRLRARLERDAPSLRAFAPGAPVFLEHLVARLLHRDPAARPQHAGEVARALAEQWARHQGDAASRLPPDDGSKNAVGAYLYRPGLVGRDAPMAALRQRIEVAATGPSGALVAVQGEAGLGKSALVAEVTRARRGPGADGARVVVVHCRGAILAPFAPFPTVLAELDEALGTTASRRVVDRPPAAAPARPEAGAGAAQPRGARFPGDDAVAARRRLAGEVVGRLLALQQHAPVVLVLEDLHEATDSARALLGELLVQLARAARPRPVVVATTRPEGRAPLAAALRDRVEVAWIDLQPLAREAVAQIAAAMLAVAVVGVPPPLVEHLARSCAGNPLLVQSELRALVDRGHLRLAAPGWTLDPDAMSGYASSDSGSPVRDRLEALGAPTRAILAAAAICGRRFDVELVCRATGAEQDAVIDALDEAIRASVVQPVRGRSAHGEYAFEHERLAEALCERLDPAWRARCHDAIGAALAERGDASAPVLAFHFSRGGDRRRAFEHLRAAARAAVDACDYEAAQRHVHAALERVDSLSEEAREEARAECTELLADALIALGHTRQGIDALDRLPMATAPPVVQARWLRKSGLARLRTTDVAEGLALLQRALALLGDAIPQGRLGVLARMLRDLALTGLRRVLRRAPNQRDQAAEERARLHRELGLLHRWIDLERSAAHLVAFIRLAHRLGVPAYRVEAHAGAAFLLSLRSWIGPAAWCHDRAHRLAMESGDLHGLARVHVVRGGAAALIERDEEVVFEHFHEGLRVAQRIGDRFLMNFALSMRGWAAALLGRPDQASSDFDRADALAAELDVPWLRDDAACGRSMIDLFHGDAGSSASTARRILASDIRLTLPVFEAFANEMLGGQAFIAGRFRSARSYFERARAHYTAHRLHRGWGMVTKMLYGETLLCLVDEQGPQAVPDLAAKLRPIVRWGRVQARLPAFRGCDLLLRGVYESRRGRARVARALFAQARAIRAGGARVTYIDLWFRARMTLEGWRLGDTREAAAAALDELDGLYRSAGASGMRTWLARMREIHGL